MSNEIYEVEREDYITFIGQLDMNKMDSEQYHYEDCDIVKIVSIKTNKHLCTRITDHINQKETYFIFNYPDDDERREPKAVCKIKLDSREEVQAFFDAISKLQKEAKENAGTV